MQNKKKRECLVKYVKERLIGSDILGDKLVGIAPLEMFFTGLLFPVMSEDSILDDEEEYTSNADAIEQQQVHSIKKDKRYMPPSSAGFSFFITGKAIELRVYYRAVNFVKNKDSNGNSKPKSWDKKVLADDGKEIEFTPENQTEHEIFAGKAKINSLWRKHNDGYIVTLTLSNQGKIPENISAKEFDTERNEKTLFEINFKCIVKSGKVAEYPATEKSLLNSEERETQLRYQDLKTYAVGHGVAANWATNKQNDIEIWADFMPQVEAPQVTADTGGKDDEVLQFDVLQQPDIIAKLNEFIENYTAWIAAQKQQSDHETDQKTAHKIIENLNSAKHRMQQGVDLLTTNDNAKIAFNTMNKAMLMQWQQGDKNKSIVKEKSSYQWRPFQLGFILMTLASSIDENDDYRDTLDLIWFPTGGGKTEAYLGLMAFLFVYRRLESPTSGSGTVAIMRYTFRLLTTQQFIRANQVIFALELIRQQNQQFGVKPFSSGLWVGQPSSPNTFKEAKKYLDEDKTDKFVISHCPWCEAKFSQKNYKISDKGFHFYCTNNDCDFGKQSAPLPCNVVDEALYENPPSLLIATVDKFARLAWEPRASGFFGGEINKPPELIIQDELHLISDALGSIVGLYEVGIETALIARGVRVKYIASTATIKNASKQVKALFAKEMSLFPPAGLRYDDSYFAKTVPLNEKPGRLYVGYLVPLLSRQNCLSPLAATLLSAPVHLFKGEDEEKYSDNWWTQIIYHGSLKSVNNSSTLYQSNIQSRLYKIILMHLKEEIDNISPNFCDDNRLQSLKDFVEIKEPEIMRVVKQYLPVRNLNIKELSSKKSAEENAQIFNALAQEKHQKDAVDVALATNMVATGLDVSRLALMVINGQPLTTAEYIQASSRVGRGEIPGIVFTNYYKTQARSLSHYENFRSYHDGFYRFVEPTSVTPFTYQARTRALHAALVIAIRHSGIGLLENKSAGDFDKNSDKVKKIIKALKSRCSLAIDDENLQNRTGENIDKLLDEWHSESKSCESNKIKMVYYENDRGSQNLLCNFGEENGMWKTLQSMRNVENSALIKLISGLKKDE